MEDALPHGQPRMWLCGASAGPVKPRQLIVCYPGFPQRKERACAFIGCITVSPVTCPECPFGEKPRAVHLCLLHLCVNMNRSLSSWWTRYWAEWKAEARASSLCSSTSTPDSRWGLGRVDAPLCSVGAAPLCWAPHQSLQALRELDWLPSPFFSTICFPPSLVGPHVLLPPHSPLSPKWSPLPPTPILPRSRAAPYLGAEYRSEWSLGAWSEATQH